MVFEETFEEKRLRVTMENDGPYFHGTVRIGRRIGTKRKKPGAGIEKRGGGKIPTTVKNCIQLSQGATRFTTWFRGGVGGGGGGGFKRAALINEATKVCLGGGDTFPNGLVLSVPRGKTTHQWEIEKGKGGACQQRNVIRGREEEDP